MSQERADEAFQEALLEDDPVQLYERAPCGYLSTMPDGRIVKANATFATWTGYDPAELASRRFVDLLSVGGRIYHETHYAPMLQMQGAVREIAVDIVRKDGSRLPVLVNARLDHDEHGRPQIVRVAVFDATERRKYEQELLRAKEQAEGSERRARALVDTLQQTLVPPAPPSIPMLLTAAAYRPAGDGSEVGGDFYDVFPVTRNDWVVVLGDVSGKGAEAAVVAALVRHTVRVLAVTVPRPSDLLAQLDEAVRQHATERFCTVVIVRLRRDEGGWTATVSSGGHPPLVLARRGRQPVPVLVPGSLVGILPTATFTDQRVRLEPGDALLLHTDGVTEGRGDEGFYGEERLQALVARTAAVAEPEHLADDLVSSLLEEVLTFQHGDPRDDIAILALAVPMALAP